LHVDAERGVVGKLVGVDGLDNGVQDEDLSGFEE